MSFWLKICRKPDGICRALFHSWKRVHRCPERVYNECLKCKRRRIVECVSDVMLRSGASYESINLDWVEKREDIFVSKMAKGKHYL